MIYLIITTSIIDKRGDNPQDPALRENQYKAGIASALDKIKGTQIVPIIVENNGERKTFLDDFGIDVLYTDTNNTKTHYGNRELRDIMDTIKHFNIKDEDMIIKFTGRYPMIDNSFVKDIIENPETDCFLRFGSFLNPVNYPMGDCITGLIAMRCKYVKLVEFVPEYTSIEWSWAKTATSIENKKLVDKLGFVCYAFNKTDLVL